MEIPIIIIAVLIGVGFVLFKLLAGRLINKGMNAVERAISPGVAKEADEMIGTTVIFETDASISAVRQEIANHVICNNKMGGKKIMDDSKNGIVWSIGLPRGGNGVVIELRYGEKDGSTIAMFMITEHVTTMGGISPFVEALTEHRNQVITAFKAADANVKITADTQEVEYKMSWF